jgi:hypothetical protein
MDILYVDKCRYEIQEYKENLVCYTGIYLPYSRTLYSNKDVKFDHWLLATHFSPKFN